MTLAGEEQAYKRRATPKAVIEGRAALAVVRSLHPDIAHLQRRGAFLLAICTSTRDCDWKLVAAEVSAMQSQVRSYSTRLAEHIKTLPVDVRNHSRVLDTVKALQSAYAVLQQAESYANGRQTKPASVMEQVQRH